MDRKLKNIIIVYDYAYINGGAAKVAIRSAIELSKTYSVIYFSGVGPVCDDLKRSNVKTICLNQDDINSGNRAKSVLYGLWNLSAQKKFESLLNSYNPEDTIIHFHGWVKCLSTSVIKVAKKQHFKCLVTLHDYFSICPNGGLYNYKEKKICNRAPCSKDCYLCNCDKRSYTQKMWRVARQIIQNRFIKNNRELAFISISKLNRALVESKVKSKKFYEVVNPIDISLNNTHVSGKRNVYLYVGRVSNEKGIDLFCEAIRQLQLKGICIEAVVAGDGPLLEELRRKYTEVLFVGWKSREEIDELMRNSRCLVFPSRWYEGAPLTIIESLSRGLPCIVTDCTSATEIIVDGKNGFVFPVDDLAALMRILEKSLSDEVISCLNCIENTDFDYYRDEKHAQRLSDVYVDYLNATSF